MTLVIRCLKHSCYIYIIGFTELYLVFSPLLSLPLSLILLPFLPPFYPVALIYMYMYIHVHGNLHVYTCAYWRERVCISISFTFSPPPPPPSLSITAKIPPIDKCSQYENCDECISSDPDCQWCPFEPVSTQLTVKTVVMEESL